MSATARFTGEDWTLINGDCVEQMAPLSQAEYAIAMDAFYTAHPGQGPTSTVMNGVTVGAVEGPRLQPARVGMSASDVLAAVGGSTHTHKAHPGVACNCRFPDQAELPTRAPDEAYYDAQELVALFERLQRNERELYFARRENTILARRLEAALVKLGPRP